jgi:PhnB protein
LLDFASSELLSKTVARREAILSFTMAKINEVVAYLVVSDAKRAIEFYKHVFGATEELRLVEPSGRVGHAELDFGGHKLMLADEFPEFGFFAPDRYKGTPVTIHLHVDDCDALVERAVAAGARLERAPKDEFYGERSGAVVDPFGHRWAIGHEIEKVSPEEMQRRYDELMKGS